MSKDSGTPGSAAAEARRDDVRQWVSAQLRWERFLSAAAGKPPATAA